jgi:alkylation response protein AidB-like acyl-CoA dehydrogenase
MVTIEQRASTGVSFALTDEQKALRELAREFAANEIRPRERECDEHMRHPVDAIAKAHELGLMNVHVPEEFGGPGLSAFDGMLVGEELYWGCSGIGTSLTANGLGAGPVVLFGSDEQKAAWLPPLIESPILCSFGLSEPGAGSDVAALKTTAVPDGDEYVLNGSKTFITNAGYAAWTVVFAKTDARAGHKGMSAFIVPMDTPGVTIEQHLDKMGQRATDTSAFALQDVRVPAANRIGDEGDGFKIAMSCLDNGRYTVGAGATGTVRASLDASVKYAKERKTFGQEIGRYQLVQQMVARMSRDYEICRLLYFKVAYLKNKGLRHTREVSMSKQYACDAAFNAANDAIEVHGAYGFSAEYPVERFLRNARGPLIYEGTREIHTVLQGEYALGYRQDRPVKKQLPAYEPD